MAAGKAKIKEMGLKDNHPEKEGVEVELVSLVPELQARINKKQTDNAVSELSEKVQAAQV